MFTRIPVEITDILTDAQNGIAEVTYALRLDPVEPYYTTFAVENPSRDRGISKAGEIEHKKATFKRFEEGWRLIEK